jgi:Tol biopolymer transport system component
VVFWVRKPPPNERAFRLQITPPEGGRFIFGGTVRGGIALSPDGRIAAFVASANGGRGLWVRPLDDTRARLLVSSDGVACPSWSPDSKSIVFFREGQLQRVDLAGGTPLTICDAVASPLGTAWSSDGRIIFATLASTGFLQALHRAVHHRL